MKYVLLLCSACILFSCNSDTSGESTTSNVVETVSKAQDETAVQPDSACYLYTYGNKQQDTAALKLYTKGNDVWGKLMYLYYEKDWRLGIFSGTKKGDIISGKWVFMQEGMKDSTDVSFKMQGNDMLQKMPGYDKQTGREILSDTASYSRVYQKTDCARFPKYDFDFGL